LFILLNIFTVPNLFSSGGWLFDTEDRAVLLSVAALIVFLILIIILTPSRLKKKNTERVDDEPQPSVWDKIFAFWLPFCFYIIAQMIVLGICEKYSPYFDTSLIVILFNGIALCGLVFIWITICAVLYIVARSALWYFIGFLTLNFAPIIISYGCYEIYNTISVAPYKAWNPFNFNLFFVSTVTSIGFPIVFILITSVIIGVFVYLWRRNKKLKIIGLTAFQIIYKILVIFLISLSAAFYLSSLFIGEVQIAFNYILCFLVVALLVSIVMCYFAFRRNKPISRTIITGLAVVVSCTIIWGFIPSTAQKEAYILPDIEDIESVELFLDSIETFEVDKYFEDCIDLHSFLLKLFKDGYLPDETEYPYEEPECIADLWENASFRYKLKNEKYFNRDYRDLKASAFDDFYIRLMKSDMYAYSLQKTEIANTQIQILGKWCELPENCIEELLKTYCDELKKADKSAFYENYNIIQFNVANDRGKRRIYIPVSFTDTEKLATEYINMYAEK